jgi:hypothetical protein
LDRAKKLPLWSSGYRPRPKPAVSSTLRVIMMMREVLSGPSLKRRPASEVLSWLVIASASLVTLGLMALVAAVAVHHWVR